MIFLPDLAQPLITTEFSNTAAVRIRQLRQKVDDGHAVRLFHAVYWQGYLLRAAEAPESGDDYPSG